MCTFLAHFGYIAAGRAHSLALATNGKLYGFGYNNVGQALGGIDYERGLGVAVTEPSPPVPPTFTAYLQPASLELLQGQSAAVGVHLSSQNGGFTLNGPVTIGPVSFSVSGSKPGVSVSVSPNPASGMTATINSARRPRPPRARGPSPCAHRPPTRLSAR